MQRLNLGKNTRPVALSRILDMGYTKVSRETELYICKLTVDVQLEGLDLRVFPRESFPNARALERSLSPEEQLDLMPLAGYMTKE